MPPKGSRKRKTAPDAATTSCAPSSSPRLGAPPLPVPASSTPASASLTARKRGRKPSVITGSASSAPTAFTQPASCALSSSPRLAAPPSAAPASSTCASTSLPARKRGRRPSVSPGSASSAPAASATPVSSPQPARARGRRPAVATGAGVGVHAAPTGFTGGYIDLGPCNRTCEYCGAAFWHAERLKSTPRGERPKYTTCCRKNRVRLKYPVNPPRTIRELFSTSTFLQSVRKYNSVFAMTSLGAAVDDTINNGNGPFVFKVSGQVCHRLGSLCPAPGVQPKFLQLYIYDTANEVNNRVSALPSDKDPLSPDVIRMIMETLDRCNALVRLFRTARDICTATSVPDFAVRVFHAAGKHPYELPSTGTLGAIVYDAEPTAKDYDIIVRPKAGPLQRINNLHPSYMAFQYPLLFPFGETGWSPDLKLSRPDCDGDKRLTMNMYYAYQIHDRPGKYTVLLNSGRLFQQFLVDAYICIERNRLDYIESHQKDFRTEYLSGIHDAIARGDVDGRAIGKKIILPASFTGGPRYMYRHYQDALAICRVHGNPQYFITFTCNVKWPEIQRELARTPLLTPSDRADIVARVFEMKVHAFLAFLKEKKPFGVVVADLYTIEFQKRGLPHCHTLIWVDARYRISDACQLDEYICAEIPDKDVEPDLHRVVSECMIHGPCGLVNKGAPCMVDNTCSKKYPKSYEEFTRIDENGVARYRRRMRSPSVDKNKVNVDSSYVVPYNKVLALRFQAHINVEYCGWSMMIKYLFKYISKGPDRIRYTVGSNTVGGGPAPADKTIEIDEIRNFVDGRFICPHEAAWRIFGFPIHHRSPAVQLLAVHLDGQQSITFTSRSSLNYLVTNPTSRKTTLTEWFANNTYDHSGRDLRYVDYLSRYKWDASEKVWSRRKTKKKASIGRLVYIHPTSGELFYLRLLLSNRSGCTSYIDTRTVLGVAHSTFRAACEALGLIGDDTEWAQAFTEAAASATSRELRSLFANMLLFCEVSSPTNLWKDHWKSMSDDIALDISQRNNVCQTDIPQHELQQEVLYELEKILNSGASYSTLSRYGLPLPEGRFIEMLRNRLLMEEKCYNRPALAEQHERLRAAMHPRQLHVYNVVMQAYHTKTQILLFIYGHGGTGKTYLWNTIISGIRAAGDIVLAVAASGIASLLLPNGRTAHSRFRIPINATKESICNVKKHTNLAQLLIETSLIVWDEAPMSDRESLECLDRSLKDILDNPNTLFGGKSVLLGGDFRQTLPIKPKAPKSTVVGASLPKSYLWPSFTVIRLTENMRLHRSGITNEERTNIDMFSQWLIAVGDGRVGVQSDTSDADSRIIQIPDPFLIKHSDTAISELIQFIYDEDSLHAPTANTLAGKAIVCPKNSTADEINSLIMQKTPGELRSYLSTDSMEPRAGNGAVAEMLYPDEYLNGLTFPGIPPHAVDLKVNTPVILLRNLNQSAGLCNGTRLIITQLLPRIIEARIMTGNNVGKRVYIPRISFVHDDKELPFVFRRRQYPLRVCYAMTINKSQGQSLDKIGVYLPEHVFGHGQLYVAFSRATSPHSLKVLVMPQEDCPSGSTKNVVYSDLLREIDYNQVHKIILKGDHR